MPHLSANSCEPVKPLSDKLIRGLESSCTLLSACTALFGVAALFWIVGDYNLFSFDILPGLDHVSANTVDPARNWLTIDFESNIFSALIGLIIEVCFSIALFLTLKTLLSSLRLRPAAISMATGLRKVAVITLSWPIAAFLGEILGGIISSFSHDDVNVHLNLNISMLATGIAVLIGSIAAKKLAQTEQELESVI